MFGLVRVTRGGITLRGEDITGLKANRLVAKGVGFVPQNNNVFPSLTIEENLQMGVYQAPKKFKQRFEFVTGLFPALGDRRAQRAGSLSGGERQMVAMGRALMMEPSVLLLDEPSAGLSPALQDEVFVRTRQINRTGVSVIMVEQNARRCLQICDRGYVLDQGRNAYTASRRGPGERPEGHRALPRHPRQGLTAPARAAGSAPARFPSIGYPIGSPSSAKLPPMMGDRGQPAPTEPAAPRRVRPDDKTEGPAVTAGPSRCELSDADRAGQILPLFASTNE